MIRVSKKKMTNNRCAWFARGEKDIILSFFAVRKVPIPSVL